MRPGIRLLLLLVLAIALRGFAGPAFAVPAAVPELPAAAACHEAGDHPAPATHAHHDADDRACAIACDLAAAPALAGLLRLPAGDAPTAFNATQPVLALAAAPPPDDPPPIR
jgi:hypothetical protein